MSFVSANPPADAQSISDLKARVEAERAGEPFLRFEGRDGRQRLFFFARDGTHASVGRESSSDLVLDWDDQVSRLHARFERLGDGWEVVDDGLSRNGTFVNGERLRGRRLLNDGDTVRFGMTAVTFRSPKQEQPGAVEAAPSQDAVRLSTTQRRVLAALCRPYKGRGGFASPATDEQIAEELVISVGAVRAHVKVLYAKLDLEELPQHETRVRLVERALTAGLISDRDL
jgi:pSer/pThr/pTyr-binding forkhead associated (FHA) protein